MTTPESRIREVLMLRHRMNELIGEYDGVEGYLGESFCQTHFEMRRTPRGTNDIDGYLGDKSVQVKFKWVSAENLATRYVEISAKAEFDWLIVVCAEDQDLEVRLFGIWESDGVFKLRDRSNSNRVLLRELKEIPQVKDLGTIVKLDPRLVYG